MVRHFALVGLAVLMCLVASATPTSAAGGSPQLLAAAHVAAVPQADLEGVVRDDRGQPVAGAVVSALGTTALSVVSDEAGRFSFPALPEGPYLVRARLDGYEVARPYLVRVTHGLPATANITLTALTGEGRPPAVLAAGLGPTGDVSLSGENERDHDHGEVSWRLRHLRRSVLKEAAIGAVDSNGGADSLLAESLVGLGKVAGSPTRLASALLADVPWSGHLDLLTTASFDRPEDLLSMQTWVPRGVAFLALEAPVVGGHWAMRGALTQGDLSSWVVAGSYRRDPAVHRYDVGISYGVQRYLGGNADALAAVSDGARNAGSMYAYDEWAALPRLSLTYGGSYARYDYLPAGALLSPRVGVTLAPMPKDGLRIHVTAARRALAPGAEEFTPDSDRTLLPPERTFSSLSRQGFVAERVDHTELAVEREVPGNLVAQVRVFRQAVDDQLVTLFGQVTSAAPGAGLGHYYVASAGDFVANGWSVTASRTIPGRVTASVTYTNANVVWVRSSPDADVLMNAARGALPSGDARVHDLTTSVESTLPLTDTRMFLVYKVDSRFSDEAGASGGPGARFHLQLNQSLPFLRFSGAEWEMLFAIRSLFRDELVDASIFDELLVVRSPKRMVGGVTLRF